MKNKFLLIVFITFLFGFNGVVLASHKSRAGNLNDRTSMLENHVKMLQQQVSDLKRNEVFLGNRLELDTLVEMYAHGPAVVTSPALGVRRSADDAHDLMVNLSSLHEDLVLLRLRKKMDNYARSKGIPIPERPIIAISGGVEGQVDYVHNYNKFEKSDINLSRAELDVVGEAGPWATASMVISYDDGRPASAVGGTREGHSRLKIGRAFLTIGQLNKCPMYFTIGQIFAPFGKYSSYMVTKPLTKVLGRFKDRMVVLGFAHDQKIMHRGEDGTASISAEVYGYPGETRVSKTTLFEYTGFNLDLGYSQNKFAVNVGSSIIGNIAESSGMQEGIFGKNYSGMRTMNNRVFGIDGRIKVSYDMFTLLAEYVGAVRRFNMYDLNFNGKAARPQAMQVEGAIEFKILDRPNTFAVGYGQSWQALALSLPRNTMFAEYNVSIWKNTIFSVEYRHDINYNWNDYAQGSQVAIGGPAEINVNTIGRHKNTVTAQIGVYF